MGSLDLNTTHVLPSQRAHPANPYFPRSIFIFRQQCINQKYLLAKGGGGGISIGTIMTPQKRPCNFSASQLFLLHFSMWTLSRLYFMQHGGGGRQNRNREICSPPPRNVYLICSAQSQLLPTKMTFLTSETRISDFPAVIVQLGITR